MIDGLRLIEIIREAKIQPTPTATPKKHKTGIAEPT